MKALTVDEDQVKYLKALAFIHGVYDECVEKSAAIKPGYAAWFQFNTSSEAKHFFESVGKQPYEIDLGVYCVFCNWRRI